MISFNSKNKNGTLWLQLTLDNIRPTEKFCHWRWLGALVSVIVSIITLLFWQVLVLQENRQLRRKVNFASLSVKQEIAAQMENRILSLRRMAKRWEQMGGTPQEQWYADVQNHLQDYPGFQAIEWIDSSFHVRWLLPLAGNEEAQNLNLAFESRRRVALEAARDKQTITLTRTITLVQGGKGFLVYVPIFLKTEKTTRQADKENSSINSPSHSLTRSSSNRFDGFILGVFRIQSLCDTLLDNNVAPGYELALFDGDQEIYRRSHLNNQLEKQWVQQTEVNLYGVTWTIKVWPTSRLLEKEKSLLPQLVLGGGLVIAVLLLHNVTQSQKLTRELSWQARHDSLTGLVNRRTFEQKLVEALVSAREKNQQHTLCYLDLDQFKIVNDTCGHLAGDELLRQVTVLLQKRVRSADILARLGGDEFGLLLYQCSLENVLLLAEQLRKLIEDFRFPWGGNSFTISASIGLVAIDAHSQDLNSILGAADAACYAAKRKGRNCIHIYQPDDLELAQQRGERHWIAKINQALEDNLFRLYSQRIVPVMSHSGKESYEILLRLVNEKGELVRPMAFIPAAERYNLMPTIDRWVISTFFDSYQRYYQAHLTEGESRRKHLYTINLSGASVNNERFVDFLQSQLTRYLIEPQTICFEITETAAIANLSQAAQLIESLKELGCCFALDDFGTGMSSLAYLKNLPVDYLKIDGSFIRNLLADPISCLMVESFNRISHAMGIQTIAEFVENEATLSKLRELGVDYAQGYAIARPSPLNFN